MGSVYIPSQIISQEKGNSCYKHLILHHPHFHFNELWKNFFLLLSWAQFYFYLDVSWKSNINDYLCKYFRKNVVFLVDITYLGLLSFVFSEILKKKLGMSFVFLMWLKARIWIFFVLGLFLHLRLLMDGKAAIFRFSLEQGLCLPGYNLSSLADAASRTLSLERWRAMRALIYATLEWKSARMRRNTYSRRSQETEEIWSHVSVWPGLCLRGTGSAEGQIRYAALGSILLQSLGPARKCQLWSHTW